MQTSSSTLFRLRAGPYARSLSSASGINASIFQTRSFSTDGDGDGDAQRNEAKPQHVGKRKVELEEMARISQASETVSSCFYLGQQYVTKNSRPDLKYFVDAERDNLQRANDLLLRHRARPSMLQPTAMAIGYAIGVITSLAGRDASMAAAGALRDVTQQHYNDAMRTMMEQGTYVQEEELRSELKALRDADRAPQDSPRAPGIEALADPKSLTATDAIGATVRGVFEAVLGASRRV
eukprot:jgi/Tetstr1/420557/TSEL_011647.t1